MKLKKYGRSVRVARGVAESSSKFLSELQTTAKGMNQLKV